MTREKKYPDTSTFHFFNANPHHRITTDCVERAIATATGLPYEEVVFGLAQVHAETGYAGNSKEGIDRYLKSLGWEKQNQPRKKDKTKYTGEDFCKELRKPYAGHIYVGKDVNRMIANIGGHHIVAIVDCKVWDIWNSTGGCIGNYWTYERDTNEN